MRTLVLAASAFALAPAASALPHPKVPWVRLTTEHFTLTSNAGLEDTAKVASELERTRAVLAALMSIEGRDPVPCSVIIEASRAALKEYKQNDRGKQEQVGGYWLTTPDGNVLVLGTLRGLTAREAYLRAFLVQQFPPLPDWFEEGIVQFYLGMEFAPEHVVLGRDQRPFRAIGVRGFVPLSRVLGLSRPLERDLPSRDLDFRAHAAAFVHYIMMEESRQARTMAFLTKLSDGEPPAEAFVASFGSTVDAVDAAFRDYATARYLGRDDRVITGPVPSPVEVPPLGTEVPRSEVLTTLGDVLLARGQGAGAPAEEHFRAALALAPDSARANSGLGMVLDAREQHAAAVAFHARALALDGESATIHFRAGENWVMQAHAGTLTGEAEEAAWRSAREHFLRAIQLAPGNASCLLGLGVAHSRHAYEDSAEGIRALEKMRRLLPGRADVLLPLGAIYLRRGEADRARRVLALATVSPSAEVAAAARDVMAGIAPPALPQGHVLAEGTARVEEASRSSKPNSTVDSMPPPVDRDPAPAAPPPPP